MPRTLRTRLILASLLWSSGLLMLTHVGFVIVHNTRWMFPYDMWIGVAIGLAFAIPGFLIGRSCLTPFRELRGRLHRLHRGEGDRIDGSYPVEVQPLVDDLNILLHQREEAIRRARASAGDMAHGLKTPLAILSQEAERAEAEGHGEVAAGIQAQVERMTRLVNYQLARARSAASGSGSPQCHVAPVIAALLRTLNKLYTARGLRIRASVPDDATLRVRPEDLEEFLGNLLDNACKWAKGEVLVDVGAAVIRVHDDGMGLDPAQWQSALGRGVRLDQGKPGSGLGLAIARDLIEMYGGSISLGKSPLGGLMVKIELPESN